MRKREKKTLKITPEGLCLVTALSYGSIAEMSGLYNKEVFLSEGFSGDVQYLFQALGNLGAHPRSKDLNTDIHLIVISNKTMASVGSENVSPFITELEEKLNQNNSVYRRMKFLSEYQLIRYLKNRTSLTEDAILEELIKKYDESKKLEKKKEQQQQQQQQQSLF
jgi:hypothetical protein